MDIDAVYHQFSGFHTRSYASWRLIALTLLPSIWLAASDCNIGSVVYGTSWRPLPAVKHLANPMVLTGAWESQVMTVFFSFDNFLYTCLEASACSCDIWLVAGLRLPAGYALAERFSLPFHLCVLFAL